jgi:aspartyl-tRNA(Asn)/glutamyl-tRNA(Gln) amidotransferase subunit B
MRLSSKLKHLLTPVYRAHIERGLAKKTNKATSSASPEKVDDDDDLRVKIGLEIHARILSKTKIFSDSDCFNITQSAPNANVSYFDLSLPGTMPTLNGYCVQAALITALALNCKINAISSFERKHYFYSDLPAGYQITQQKQPIAIDGQFTYPVIAPKTKRLTYKDCKIKRIQLEHDSARSLQVDSLELKLGKEKLAANTSLIDLNRAGMGLMEIVTEPDFEEAFDAYSFVRELALLLKSLETCESMMGEGGFRVDVNVSVHELDAEKRDQLLPGVRVELKNLSSFNAVLKGTQYEIKRQKDLKKSGAKIEAETRTFDTTNGRTISLRSKEDQYDYRFMPEPNLLPLIVYPSQSFKLGGESESSLKCLNNPELIVSQAFLDAIPSMGRNFVDLDKAKVEYKKKLVPQTRRDHVIETFHLSHENAFVFIANNLDLILIQIVAEKKSNKWDKEEMQQITGILLNDYLHQVNVNSVNLEKISTEIKARKIISFADLTRRKLISRRIRAMVFESLFSLENLDKLALDLVQEKNWFIINDTVTINKSIEKLFAENAKAIEDYRQKEKKRLKIFDFFVGRVHKDLADLACPELVDKLVLENLKKLI